MPFSDYLTERIEKKNTWNNLHDRIARALASNDQKEFIAASYALAQFISSEISGDDPRRREVMLAVIQNVRDAPDASDSGGTSFRMVRMMAPFGNTGFAACAKALLHRPLTPSAAPAPRTPNSSRRVMVMAGQSNMGRRKRRLLFS
jgi:hypothetical protein